MFKVNLAVWRLHLVNWPRKKKAAIDCKCSSSPLWSLWLRPAQINLAVGFHKLYGNRSPLLYVHNISISVQLAVIFPQICLPLSIPQSLIVPSATESTNKQFYRQFMYWRTVFVHFIAIQCTAKALFHGNI